MKNHQQQHLRHDLSNGKEHRQLILPIQLFTDQESEPTVHNFT